MTYRILASSAAQTIKLSFDAAIFGEQQALNPDDVTVGNCTRATELNLYTFVCEPDRSVGMPDEPVVATIEFSVLIPLSSTVRGNIVMDLSAVQTNYGNDDCAIDVQSVVVLGAPGFVSASAFDLSFCCVPGIGLVAAENCPDDSLALRKRSSSLHHHPNRHPGIALDLPDDVSLCKVRQTFTINYRRLKREQHFAHELSDSAEDEVFPVVDVKDLRNSHEHECGPMVQIMRDGVIVYQSDHSSDYPGQVSNLKMDCV